MMVDVQDERVVQPLETRSPEIAALEDDQGVKGAADRLGDLDPIDVGKRLVLERRAVPIDDPGLLADRAKAFGQRHGRPDGVAIGPDV